MDEQGEWERASECTEKHEQSRGRCEAIFKEEGADQLGRERGHLS